MAGILANSASKTMVDSDAAADQALSGWIRNEKIALTTSPAASSSYLWALTGPTSSSAGKAYISETTGSTPSFVPDVGGTYVITCTADGSTSYTLRATVLDTAAAEPVEAVRLTPRADSQVAAPSLGVVMYYSSTQDGLAIKDANGNVSTVDTTAV